MPLNCSSVAIKVPHQLGLLRSDFKSQGHVRSFFFFLGKTPKRRFAERISCVSSDLKQSFPSLTMEDKSGSEVGLEESCSFEEERVCFEKELEIGVKAVQMACALCQRVQEGLISKTGNGFQSKDDNSPVTVAG